MPYVTDGSVHHTGVRNEHRVADLFNLETPPGIQAAYPDKILTFVHRGGTHQVDDVEVMCGGVRVSGISTKHHGGSGTFDYINTSKVSDYIPESSTVVRTFAELRTAHRGSAEALPAVRNQVKESISGLWASLTSDSVRTLLQTIHSRNSEWVSVVSPDGILTVGHSALVELAVHPFDPDMQYELRSTRATSSRQIWRVKDGVATNTHLRVRLALNNGVGALIGLSKANANAILTLKIQQDNVGGLLKFLQASPA